MSSGSGLLSSVSKRTIQIPPDVGILSLTPAHSVGAKGGSKRNLTEALPATMVARWRIHMPWRKCQ